MFKKLVRTESLEPTEIEVLSGVFQRCVGIIRLNGYNDRQDLAFEILEHYSNGYSSPEALITRVIRDHRQQLKGVA